MIRDQFSHVPNSGRRWQLRNPERTKELNDKRNALRRNDPIAWQEKLERDREYQRRKNRECREKLVAVAGGKCIRCGFSDIRALQFDHVLGGGCKERKKMDTKSFSSWRNYDEFLEGFKIGKYQLLCANCNWIKRHENKENWYAGRTLQSQ